MRVLGRRRFLSFGLGRRPGSCPSTVAGRGNRTRRFIPFHLISFSIESHQKRNWIILPYCPFARHRLLSRDRQRTFSLCTFYCLIKTDPPGQTYIASSAGRPRLNARNAWITSESKSNDVLQTR